jgi:hypothetical protein
MILIASLPRGRQEEPTNEGAGITVQSPEIKSREIK